MSRVTLGSRLRGSTGRPYRPNPFGAGDTVAVGQAVLGELVADAPVARDANGEQDRIIAQARQAIRRRAEAGAVFGGVLAVQRVRHAGEPCPVQRRVASDAAVGIPQLGAEYASGRSGAAQGGDGEARSACAVGDEHRLKRRRAGQPRDRRVNRAG